MPVPRSDPQRDKVYDLETNINGWWTYSSIPTKELLAFLVAVCKYYRVDIPKLRVIRDRKCGDTAWYDHAADEIVLNRSREGTNVGVLCHEAAHYLIDCFYTDTEVHGPEFVAIYMHLLDHFCLLPHTCFRLLAKKYRLRIGRRYRPNAFKSVISG